MMLKGKKILIGITGSIAAYKSILLVRQFIKAGADVKVILTPSAKDFVSPLTLSTLSKNPVLADLSDDNNWANHVMLGRWADIMIIAPLSCNTLAKMANGICDNLLMAIYLSVGCPVVVAPAMDEDMWLHPTTKLNLAKLESFGNKIIPAGKGELASGLIGEGRMAEPEQIVEYLSSNIFLTKPLEGKKALVTAGPTYEPLDPVRFIGNHSSGKMGVAIARELNKRGAEVTLILGPTTLALLPDKVTLVKINTAGEMYNACHAVFPEMDIAVMAAAVADYSPAVTAKEKIKKTENKMLVELVKTKDILKSLGEKKKPGQVLAGFALETHNEEFHAMEKLKNKKADLIVLNSMKDPHAGFGHDTNTITIFDKSGKKFGFESKTKDLVAKDIVDTIINLYYA